ncbi:MAG: benzoate/H(+) symporter BenE family transporter [Xanthomonadales bacterium]|nr:benzoate/H(+) symporter BenE family transporter [Xanthomonadales bacterium]
MTDVAASLRISHLATGLTAVLVGYAGTVAIVFQAAAAVGASQAQLASWLWALGIGTGLSTLALSLAHRAPVLTAWSTPGAALLATSLPGLSMAEAVAAFLFCSFLLTCVGLFGWFDAIVRNLPRSLAAAMLAGVLLRFGLDAFAVLPTEPVLVLAMLAAWLAGWVWAPRLAVPLLLGVGLLTAVLLGQVDTALIELRLAMPVWTTPVPSVAALLGVGLPLCLVTLAAQNLPGIAVLRGNGYELRASPLIGWTGFTGLALGPFGGYAFNLAAITAAICAGPQSDPDPNRRWLSSMSAGGFYLVAGLMGASVASVLAALPIALVALLAGLALLSTLAGSLASALEDAGQREAAIVTFLVTGSGMAWFGLGSGFWGLVFGLGVHWAGRWRVRGAQDGR